MKQFSYVTLSYVTERAELCPFDNNVIELSRSGIHKAICDSTVSISMIDTFME